MTTVTAIVAMLAVLTLFAPAPGLAGPADAHWADVESQIQYAFYAEDLRALENLAASLDANVGNDAHAAYFAALAAYDLAEATRDRDRVRAAAAADRCADAIASGPPTLDEAEALALAGACTTLSHSLQSFRFPLVARRAESDLARALKLAPRNPRVVLLDAVATYDRSNAADDRDRARRRLEEATRLFEVERKGVAVTPGWGAAAAYAWLGRSELDRGDATAARAALEQALLLAPDFALAHRLMARILGQ